MMKKHGEKLLELAIGIGQKAKEALDHKEKVDKELKRCLLKANSFENNVSAEERKKQIQKCHDTAVRQMSYK